MFDVPATLAHWATETVAGFFVLLWGSVMGLALWVRREVRGVVGRLDVMERRVLDHELVSRSRAEEQKTFETRTGEKIRQMEEHQLPAIKTAIDRTHDRVDQIYRDMPKRRSNGS